MIERTLVLVKPDGVKRALIGEILKRFETKGLKIVGLKMFWADNDFAKKHYTEDITKRRGEHIRNFLIDFITEGPVVAICLEGVEAVENVRKIVGPTEPKAALPGTIRGDFTHVSYSYTDQQKKAVRNLIHASANKEEANEEVALWFSPDELYNYKIAHEEHIF